MSFHIVLTDLSSYSYSTTHPVWTPASLPLPWPRTSSETICSSLSLLLHPSIYPSILPCSPLWPLSVLQLAGSVRHRDSSERSPRQQRQRAGQQGAGVLLPPLQDGDGGLGLGAGRAGTGACGEDAGAHPLRRCQGKQRHVPTLRLHAQTDTPAFNECFN